MRAQINLCKIFNNSISIILRNLSILVSLHGFSVSYGQIKGLRLFFFDFSVVDKKNDVNCALTECIRHNIPSMKC